MTPLLALFLLLQGIPVQRGGTVTGTLRDSKGVPVEGIRVAAVAKAGTPEESIGAAAMAGIAETDAQGHFKLENIPPGRYVIAAGRLDRQTYHPGTQSEDDATVVTIATGSSLTDINFVISDNSFGRANDSGSIIFLLGRANVPFIVTEENGGKIPLSANGKLVAVLLGSPVTGVATATVDSNVISVPGPTTADFRVGVTNLPEPYVIKSIRYGNTDITQGTLRLIPANFSVDPNGPPAAFVAGLASANNVVAVLPPTQVTPPQTLTIVIGRRTGVIPVTSGVVVSGSTNDPSKRVVSISGKPGIFFSDGTFEFRDVPPGRHLITATGSSLKPMAGIVMVGEQAVQGIQLQETPMIPAGSQAEQNALPTGDYKPGSTIPLARVSGVVFEEVRQKPLAEGEVIIKNGNSSRTVPIDAQGRFEALHLLPGTYDLKVQAFGHATTEIEVTVDDKDIMLELTTRRLY